MKKPSGSITTTTAISICFCWARNPRSCATRAQPDFSDQTADFPFVAGHAADAAIFAVRHDTAASDLAVAYRDRAGVLYRDRLNGKYEAVPLDAIPAGATAVLADDFNNDGFPDLAALVSDGCRSDRESREASCEPAGQPLMPRGPAVFADLENRGVADLVARDALYRNRGEGKLERQDAVPAGLGRAWLWPPRISMATAALDLAAVSADGSAARLRKSDRHAQ